MDTATNPGDRHHSPRAHRPVRALIAVCAAISLLGAAGAAAGCGRPAPAEAVVLPNSVPVADAASKDAVTRALAAYNGYLDAYVTAAATGDWTAKALDSFTADPLRQQLHLTLRNYARAGVVLTGRPGTNPRVSSVEVLSTPHYVTFVDCFDTTGWKPVFKATGRSAAAPNQTLRYQVTIKAEEYPGGKWFVQQVNGSLTAPC